MTHHVTGLVTTQYIHRTTDRYVINIAAVMQLRVLRVRSRFVYRRCCILTFVSEQLASYVQTQNTTTFF